MTDREEILKLLAVNAGTIAENLSEFWFRHAEDLEAVGVDPTMIATSLSHVATVHLLKNFGADGALAVMDREAQTCRRLKARLSDVPQARH